MIERLYPGVYVAEMAFSAKPIDGVPTTTSGTHDFALGSHPAERAAHPTHTPEWTNPSAGDPGVTLVELFSYVTESLLYRTDLPSHGSVRGLLVQAQSADRPLKVSPGLALDASGQATETGLSATASKYIGETEKNLGSVFSDAPPSRALLRYDDSDALFGKDD